jgi:hypothetical protein
MKSTLEDLMVFGHIVQSDGNGNVEDTDDAEYGPEVLYVELDDDGQMSEEPRPSEIGYGDWVLLSGFTGQYGYHGAVMHDSEYVGGNLERHIRDTAGLFVAVLVDGELSEDSGESVPVGWAVAFKEL